ncbi:unnamed protein product [Cuscuta epithymum]|uniref:DUF538 family protein n=1 Tax=Cuscuta epithymum TaxID=186058 RepID=A0AAV0CZ63_9ASTE|nr:unnamed protein product [Cuscuta epithymum]CAH9128961.1 unnamed protein product [Cuscuta epithymum]
MEKALSIVSLGSKKASSFWLTKKAKEELNNITKDFNAVTNTVEETAKMLFEKLKGMPQESLSDLLKRHNLPVGLFPEKIISFEYDKLTSKLIVHLPSPCEVTFGDRSAVRYSTRVKAILRNNKLTDVEGMRIKVLLWVNVTGVYVEGLKSDKVCFITAGVTKSRPMAVYNYHGKAAIVAEF